MENSRTQEIERMLKDYFAGYNYLSGAPEDVIRKMKKALVVPATVVERLVSKALSAVAVLEPCIEKLSISDMQLISELYDSNESVKHQVEGIAASRYTSARTVYRMRLEVLGKIDSLIPATITAEERDVLFDTRWRK